MVFEEIAYGFAEELWNLLYDGEINELVKLMKRNYEPSSNQWWKESAELWPEEYLEHIHDNIWLFIDDYRGIVLLKRID